MQFDWNELAFASKKPLNELNAIFVAAPRELSAARIKQLIKTYLPKGNLIFGAAKEPYVLGLDLQPQFKMLEPAAIQPIIDQVNASQPKYSITTLAYFQRDLPFILEKLDLAKVVFINASWYFSFHLRKEYYILTQKHLPYELVSPFTDEAEAKAFAQSHEQPTPQLPSNPQSDAQMMQLAYAAAKQSFDYSTFQTGGALAKKEGSGYHALATTFNRNVPYLTYSWHHGASRERQFSPMNDLNFYDTNHYEIELLLHAQSTGLDLSGTTLFCNVMHCPPCARMICRTPITEIVYSRDHGDDYAIKLLEQSGKTVRRPA